MEGRDLSVRMQGPDGAGQGSGDMIFLRNAGTSPNWVAAIDARYKLVLSTGDRPWLFDHEQDPDELLNFYERPGAEQATRRLAEGLSRYASESKDPFFAHPRIASSLTRCLNDK